MLVVASSLTIAALTFYTMWFAGSVVAANSIKSARVNDGDKAVRDMNLAIQLSPLVSTYPRIRSEYHLALIEVSPTTRETLEPLVTQDLNRAITLNPWYHRHYIKAAEAAEQLDQPEQGIRLYNRAIRLVPNSSRLHNRVAASLIDIDRPEDAIPYIDNAIRLTGDNDWSYQSYYLAGIAFENMQQPNNAAAAVIRSLERSPNSELCALSVEYLYQRVVDIEEVYPDISKCTNYQANPSNQVTEQTP